MSDPVSLVAVAKAGVVLRVHPSTVAAHISAGWTPAGEPDEPDAGAVEPAVEPKARRKRTPKPVVEPIADEPDDGSDGDSDPVEDEPEP